MDVVRDGAATAAPSVRDRAAPGRVGLRATGRWFMLPTLPLADGGRARRLNVAIDEDGLMSVVLSATGNLLGVSFELVEWRGGDDHAHDPRLGQARIDGRTACFGLVETARTSLVFSALSTTADERLVHRLRTGRELRFEFAERAVAADLDGFGDLFERGLKSICDPRHLPVARWLAG